MKERVVDNFYFLAVKGACNTNCSFCNFFEQKQKPIYIEHFQELKDEVDEVCKKGYKKICIGVDGYEPTMFPYFLEILQYIKTKDIYIYLNSNGVLFSSNSFTEKVHQYIDKIHITLYASNNTEHFLYTQKRQSYKVKLKAIENCLNYKIQVQTSILLLKTNIQSLNKIILSCKPYWRHKYFLKEIRIIEPSCQMGYIRNKALVPEYMFIIDRLNNLLLGDVPTSIKITLSSSIPKCISQFLKNKRIIEKFGGSFSLELDFIDECVSCDYKSKCQGIDIGYLEAFGNNEFGTNTLNTQIKESSHEDVLEALKKAKEEILGR